MSLSPNLLFPGNYSSFVFSFPFSRTVVQYSRVSRRMAKEMEADGAKTSSKGYPKCRPSVKVSGKTPKTSGSICTR